MSLPNQISTVTPWGALHNQYDLIPWYEELNKPSPFKKGQTYDTSDPKWNKASNTQVGIRLNELVLIDWDGYKSDTTAYDELAEKLSMTPDELLEHCVQWNKDNSSLHFLFKLPGNINLASIKNSNDGKWLKGIDIKTGNQLCYIKTKKQNRFVDFSPAVVPSVVVDALKSHDTKRPKELQEDMFLNIPYVSDTLSRIDPNCDYSDWCNVIAGTVQEYGKDSAVIDLLDQWSSKGAKYKGYDEVFNKAHSFNRDSGVTWGTVLHLAEMTREQNKTKRQTASEAFKNAPRLTPDNVVHLPLPSLPSLPSLSVSHDGEQSIYPDVKIQRNGTKILSTADNLKSLLSQLNVQVATNRMNLNMDVQHGDSVHEWDYDELRSYLISEAEKTRLPKVAIDEHLTAIAIKNSYHPIEAKFTHKQWDGIPRVQRVINCLPTDNTIVRDVIMRKWLIAAVAAIYQPNFSTKLVPVLKGTQSAMKSAFISRVCSILPNSFLGESDLNADDVDSVIRVLSHHIVELAELERTTKREAGSLKAFITSNEDKFRKKYGRSDTAKKRQTVFIATVNDDEFFKDSTGNTRFGVIDLNGVINMDEVNSVLGYSYNNGRIRHDRPDELIQFWLEVKQWFDSGESWMLTSDEQVMTEEINNNYAVKSQYYHDILENIHWFMPDIGVTSTKIANLMGLPRGCGGRVGRALNELVRDGHLRQGAGRERRSYYKA